MLQSIKSNNGKFRILGSKKQERKFNKKWNKDLLKKLNKEYENQA